MQRIRYHSLQQGFYDCILQIYVAIELVTRAYNSTITVPGTLHNRTVEFLMSYFSARAHLRINGDRAEQPSIFGVGAGGCAQSGGQEPVLVVRVRGLATDLVRDVACILACGPEATTRAHSSMKSCTSGHCSMDGMPTKTYFPLRPRGHGGIHPEL